MGENALGLDSSLEPHVRFSQDFEEKNKLMDETKERTDKIVEHLQTAITELYDWGKKSTPSQPNRYESLADALTALGQRMPVDSGYGAALLAINRAVRVSGGQQRRLQRAIEDEVINPLRHWVKEQYNTFDKERRLLHKLKTDMETATRKALKTSSSEKGKKRLDETTTIYVKQWRTVKKWLDKLPEMHEQHKQYMLKILTLEKDYHATAVDACELSLRVVSQMDVLSGYGPQPKQP